jgi:hypothetical protein
MQAAIEADAPDTQSRPRRFGWLLALGLLLAALSIGYTVWPLYGAWRVVEAAREADAAALESRINFNRLRRSLARQLVAEALRARPLQGAERQLAYAAGMTAVSLYLDQLLTAEAMADLLGGRPVTVNAGERMPIDLSGLRIVPAGTAFDIWRRSGFTGLGAYEIVFDRPSGRDGLRVGLELQGLTWRLTSLTLPQELLEDLARRIEPNRAP